MNSKTKKHNKQKPVPFMPQRLPGDHPHVTALLDESVRLNDLGCRWAMSKPTNPIAADAAFRNGWAMNLAACWLRCYLKGELESKP